MRACTRPLRVYLAWRTFLYVLFCCIFFRAFFFFTNNVVSLTRFVTVDIFFIPVVTFPPLIFHVLVFICLIKHTLIILEHYFVTILRVFFSRCIGAPVITHDRTPVMTPDNFEGGVYFATLLIQYPARSQTSTPVSTGFNVSYPI